MAVWIDEFETPVGRLIAVAEDGALTGLEFGVSRERVERILPGGEAERGRDPLGMAGRLEAYFERRDREAFAGLLLAPRGTEFQQRVWAELQRIGWGETRSYREVAERIGSPKGVRAVGLANGANPVAIVVPCHRVIGTDGSLTGYGGGIERKRWLLVHEGALLV